MADIKIAIASLKATKVRTVLTIIGIVVGVASVTTILALGEGAKQAVSDQAKQFGGDVVTVRPGGLTRDDKGDVVDYDLLANFNAGALTEEDLNIVSGTPGVQSAAPIMGLRGDVGEQKKGGNAGQIIATDDELPEVLQQRVKVGEFVNSEIDRNTVVFGSALANELLGSDQTIGQEVELRGEKYTLIGVMEQVKTPLALNGLYDVNHAAYVTLDAGKAMNQGIAQIQTINFRIADGANREEVISTVEKRLKDAHGTNDVAVIGSETALQIIEHLFMNFTGYTAAIAAISLIVGGIGVMNIMLVAVTERTREIGIRKAVGATNGQVMRQFLVESIVMSLAGGVIGVLLAVVIATAISLQFGLPAAFTLDTVGWALGVSVIVGVLFGTFPALRAARKNPITALRQIQ